MRKFNDQIMVGAHSYAQDNNSWFPSRAKPGGYPHQMKRIWNRPYNLNPGFIKPYQLTDIMFCPGHNVGPSTDSDGEILWSTYQYLVWPEKAWNWLVPQPDLEKPVNIKGSAPIWSCLTVIKNGGVTAPHGQARTTGEPTGLNSGMSDGSAKWVDWKDAEMFWRMSYNDHCAYWPIYRE